MHAIAASISLTPCVVEITRMPLLNQTFHLYLYILIIICFWVGGRLGLECVFAFSFLAGKTWEVRDY